jgi:hypothetical protein
VSKSGLKLVFNVSIVYGNLNSENSQDNSQKPQRNCMFMNSASVRVSVGCGPVIVLYTLFNGAFEKNLLC